jgi:hypothetical protein
MDRIIALSLLAAQPSIKHHEGCFELYGYDILIDCELHAWLL